MEYTIKLSDLIGLCGVITALWGVYKIYVELMKPSRELKKKVELHDTYLENDKQSITEIQESNKIMCKCMLVLINHEITGNGIDKMKSMRDELNDYLIEK